MNFKFTKIKTTVTSVLALIAGVIIFFKWECFDSCGPGAYLTPAGITIIIVFSLIYILWSFFEKK